MLNVFVGMYFIINQIYPVHYSHAVCLLTCCIRKFLSWPKGNTSVLTVIFYYLWALAV